MKERLHALRALARSVIGSHGASIVRPCPVSFYASSVGSATTSESAKPGAPCGLRVLYHTDLVVKRLCSHSFFSRTTTKLADSEYRRSSDVVQSLFAVPLQPRRLPVAQFHA